MRWQAERRWLNKHRSELARLAAELYPVEHRIPGTSLIAHPDWTVDEPVDLEELHLSLDEQPQSVGVDGSEAESEPTRPLRSSSVRFDRYTSASELMDALDAAAPLAAQTATHVVTRHAPVAEAHAAAGGSANVATKAWYDDL